MDKSSSSDDPQQQSDDHSADREHDHEQNGDDRSRQHQPSMIKNLLITAGVALVSGALGATGYAYFFAPEAKGSSLKGPQVKSDSSSTNESGSDEKSGRGASKKSDEESGAQASATRSNPGVATSEDAGSLKQKIKDLAHQLDHLRERVDGLTQPTDATPLALRTMQIKMSELIHAMADLAALPAAYRQCDSHLKAVDQVLETLRERIDAAQADSIGGRAPSLNPITRIAAPTPSVNGSTASNPTDQRPSRPER